MMYGVGDIVLENGVGSNVAGEIRIIMEIDMSKTNPFRVSRDGIKHGIWAKQTDLMRHATPEEIVEWQSITNELIEREISRHEQAIQVLRNKLANTRSVLRT